MGRLRHGTCGLLLAGCALLLVACGAQGGSEAKGKSKKDLRYPVEVQPVATALVSFAISAPGSVEAFETVSVTARVPGVAEKVTFAIGDRITTDQVLVEIEPERYRLAVEQAKAAVTKAEATKADAESALRRRENADRANPGLVRAEDLQTSRTKVLAAAADLEAARTAQAKAALDLRDALIRAPIAGIVQTRQVQTGQYVQTGMTLTTLLRRDPLYVVFQVSELDATRLALDTTVDFTVTGSDRIGHARIVHIAAAADTSSRMVPVRAHIAEPEAKDLRPGAFAQCTITLPGITAPVIPQMAVRPSEKGFVAYVVAGDGIAAVAQERLVKLGQRDREGRVEVIAGLKPGERLVVRGAEALRDGILVDVRPPEAVTPAASAAEAKKP